MKMLSTILLVVSIHASAQTYTVIHSIGKILDTKTGKYLAKGSKVDESSAVMFETKGARAAVLSSSRGRFVIQEQASSQNKSDIVYTLSSVISPARGRLSTRAGGINNKLDFEKYFEEPVALLGNIFNLEVSPTAYPMDDSKFFYAQYQYNGEAINKKLSNDGTNIVLEIGDFFSIDGNPIEAEEVSAINLFYYNAETQESTRLTSMAFSIVPNEDLKSIAGQMKDDRSAMLEIIHSMYGKCSEAYLEQALKDL